MEMTQAIESELARKITDFRHLGLPKLILREAPVHMVDLAVSIIVGARRSGKSFRSLQCAQELIEKGWIRDVSQVCHIDFDNPVLATCPATRLHLIQDTFLRLSPGQSISTPILFIFDELHVVDGWERYVVDLSRNPNWKVVVTGSSSKMLHTDIATELRGKSICTEVTPLSFREYVAFHQTEPPVFSTDGMAALRRHFDQYLAYGSYPAIARIDPATVDVLLHEYFNIMILKDVIQRHAVSNADNLIVLCRYLFSQIGRPFTLNSTYNHLVATGMKTSRNALTDYVGWLRDSFALDTVGLFTSSLGEYERNYRKPYAVDWALAVRNNPVWDGSLSRAFENCIYRHLRGQFKSIGYYLTKSDKKEVDFVCIDASGKPLQLVQACLEFSSVETFQREIGPLVATARYLGTKENLVVTVNTDEVHSIDGVEVRCVPAWRWLVRS